MKYKFIDLFAGCGGLEDGFLQSEKYKAVASVEWLKPQVNTLIHRLEKKWNYQNAKNMVLHFDIQRENELFLGWNNDKIFSSSVGLDTLVNQNDGVDVIIGGPPCQAYSIAGRVRDENGMHNDYRNFLFEHYLNIVCRYRPKAFLFENVTGILSANPQGINIIQEIRNSFQRSDIKKLAVINAVDYSVPQNRKRVIILGVREDLINHKKISVDQFYTNYLPQYKGKRKITVKEAISDLDKFFPLWDDAAHKNKRSYKEKNTSINWHKPRYHNIRDMKIYAMLARDIETGENKYTSSEAISKVYENFIGASSPIHR